MAATMEQILSYRQIKALALCIPFLVHSGSANLLVERQNVAPPSKLPDTWSYQGCYTDSVDKRTLRGANTGSATNNATTCISYCAARAYAFAGTEYGQECYCGNAIASTGTKATSGCSMACSGAAGEACGGPDRLSIYATTGSTSGGGMALIPGKTGNWTSLGCYSDAGGARILSTGVAPVGGAANNSAQSCIAACEVNKFKYAGTEYSAECFCGNSLDNKQEPVDDGCDMSCNGNQTQFCGGANRINIYGVNITRSVSSSSIIVASSTVLSSSIAASSVVASSTPVASPSAVVSSSAAASSSAVPSPSVAASSSALASSSSVQVIVAPPTPTPTPSPTPTPTPSSSSVAVSSSAAPRKTGWQLEGCYTDGTGGRTLTAGTAVAGGMTNAKCQAACRSAGYIFAGTEYAGECYCDNSLKGTGAPAPDGNAGCNMACSGNATEMCGGPNRLTLYKFYTGIEPTGSVSVTPVASSSALPQATGLPAGFTYKGCYIDGPGFRIMNNQQPDDAAMTIASCSNICAKAGYTIAAMEYSTQCFCDNIIRMGGKKATQDSECSNNCAGNPAQKCGGPARMSVWSSQTVLKVIDVPKPIQNVSDWTYQGCITDANGKVFPWKSTNQTGNSPEWCLGKCKEYGYQAAGMEYGEECYCGDVQGIAAANSQVAPESECVTPCPGNPEAICGAGNRLSWYKWTGTPLYVWSYPTGAAAGQYQLMGSGPVIPLISQPGINGKVYLLEKHGTSTSAVYTTGAFEFDPSNNAFREMQGIKTDIFCAAGLTMPDRAGRQINIGGWSLDSTFGVRMMTPSGAPGVPSTSVWQEDVNTIALQQGRWYPTGLVMANGSMLIVGGQAGSNGAPVPTMEILPRVGGIYEAQYLRDTDPYNLYPFLAVLPSGGIFIEYYNEARILNERTLDTVKILPKVPGAVNDPTGGRTYPLEGTQVLLPQYYPYTDPLEVLICGGAARQPGARFGLDNCVSIAPDTGNAWTIERMPSRRVMSCMATLPDGTYLILGGAHIGEAGFGLAEDPNLSALLYDSRKPKHQRISMMANTTIARLYHSEAVVLDDGRVLVSGSDPEDGKNPQELRYEYFMPPYLLSGAAKPAFTISQKDWVWEAQYTFTMTARNGGAIKVSLMGSESSTHGSSMGARILFPQVACNGNTCTVTAPKGPYIAPVGWYRMYVLDGPTPSMATWVRIGGDPGNLGNWPANNPAFAPLPGMGPIAGAGAVAQSRIASNNTVARDFVA